MRPGVAVALKTESAAGLYLMWIGHIWPTPDPLILTLLSGLDRCILIMLKMRAQKTVSKTKALTSHNAPKT